jgi:ribosomal protein S18 acetylase RimI-like enzyme
MKYNDYQIAMNIIYKGKTRIGKEITIRNAVLSDVTEMLRFINELSDEQTFITYQGEHETLESETKYLKDKLKAIKDKKSVQLLVFCDNKLVGESEIHMMEKTQKHIGVFGITISQGFRGEGTGKLLMDLILKEAKKNIPEIKIITLDVYSTNDIARGLYKKMGFKEYGVLPEGISRIGKFEDMVLMYKKIT